MGPLRFLFLFFLLACLHCKQPQESVHATADQIVEDEKNLSTRKASYKIGNEALLLTRFSSLEDFKKVVDIQYANNIDRSDNTTPQVSLTYFSGGRGVSSILKAGVSQFDFLEARNGSFWDKLKLGIKSPYAVMHRKDLMVIENLGRRRPFAFGKGDVAFYDLAEMMVFHIADEDRVKMSAEDLDEKGYLNTFNHITAQSFMTSLYSERLADFIADVHELYNMPELITGDFTPEQLEDFKNGPVDNYVDMVNNEWGQEIGKMLRTKYQINQKTFWTSDLMADYLNDIQSYHSWTFQIGFTPFRSSDEKVMRFADKINMLKKLQ